MRSGPPLQRFLGVALVAAILHGTVGCSFLTVKPAPRVAPRSGERLGCSESKTAPRLDALAAALLLAPVVSASVFSAKADHSDPEWKGTYESVVALGFSSALALGALAASAIYGVWHTSRCQNLREEREAGTLDRPCRRGPAAPRRDAPLVCRAARSVRCDQTPK